MKTLNFEFKFEEPLAPQNLKCQNRVISFSLKKNHIFLIIFWVCFLWCSKDWIVWPEVEACAGWKLSLGQVARRLQALVALDERARRHGRRAATAGTAGTPPSLLCGASSAPPARQPQAVWAAAPALPSSCRQSSFGSADPSDTFPYTSVKGFEDDSLNVMYCWYTHTYM